MNSRPLIVASACAFALAAALAARSSPDPASPETAPSREESRQAEDAGATAIAAAPRTDALGEAVPVFRAGVAVVDVSPLSWPRIIAGSFLEKQADRLVDPLFVRAFVLDDGSERIAFAIVDTCMMEQSLIDEAKAIASAQCGIPPDRMMVAATHTHSAPAAMGCLGTRKDEAYAEFLIPKIAEAIVAADAARQPARIGWGRVDDWAHTHNRRWIRLPGREVEDPYGGATGRAHMHPGYLSQDVVGPSGPIDPQLSVLALQTLEGEPLGVLANYSQHYFGASPASADYFGHFCRHLAERLGQPGEGRGPFVSAMSQGTSGDLMWMDYGAERKALSLDQYASAMADSAMAALDTVDYHDHVPLGMIETTLKLAYRVPDAERLAWAEPIAAGIEGDLPKDRVEVYAREALILHERQRTSLKLQAIRIGDLSIATLPNEVYAITGLKLREASPFSMHFNIELANGAEGYIPPPEQHALGGYTTWPARTAGLEVAAEPKIVAALSEAVASLVGELSRENRHAESPYAAEILASGPSTYLRCDDFGPGLRDEAAANEPSPSPTSPPASLSLADGHAFYLPGVGSGRGYGDDPALRPSPFSAPGGINRALHLAGGHLEIDGLDLGTEASVALWFWLGHESGAGVRSGELVGAFGASLEARQDAAHRVRLALGGTETQSEFRADDWHFAVLVREGDSLRVHLNGDETPALEGAATVSDGPLVLGRGLEGRLDEIAVWDRALEPGLIASLWETSGVAADHARDLAMRRKAAERAREQDADLLARHENWSATLRFRNDKPNDRDPVTAYLISRGRQGDGQAPGDHLGIGGTYRDSRPGRLFVFNGNAAGQVAGGETLLEPGTWHEVTLERAGSRVKVFLDGELEIDAELPVTAPGATELFFGARSDGFAPLEGEVAEGRSSGLANDEGADFGHVIDSVAHSFPTDSAVFDAAVGQVIDTP